MRRCILILILLPIYMVGFTMPGDDLPAPLTLPRDKRPAWLREQGIVMAGSWEPLVYRVRRDGSPGYEPTAEQRRLYEEEHSLKTIGELKRLGVNFVMIHCYKGFGMAAERQGMEDAKKFAALCHKEGLRVGVYVFSGTLGWELLRKEHPESKDWELLDADGNPICYGHQTFRHWMNRNHPGAQAHLKKVVDYAVKEIKADLLHFDNYILGPAFDPVSVGRFRDYLSQCGVPRDFGLTDFTTVMPSKPAAPDTALGRAWMDFSCTELARSYYDITEYARSLRPDILIECNPLVTERNIRVPVDCSRLLAYGDACWDEHTWPSFENGSLLTRQIVYKTGQSMNNIIFQYIRNPIQAAESLAYNTDCLGCIAGFMWGKVRASPEGNNDIPFPEDILPYVRFFHQQRGYYRDVHRVADVAVLRSFASQCYAPDAAWQATRRVEQYCIEGHIPWAMVFDRQVADLKLYRAVSLVGAEALSDKQIAQIRAYVHSGGGLILTEETARFNENMQPREADPFANLMAVNVVRIKADAGREEYLLAARKAVGGSFSVSTAAPPYLQIELTEQKKSKRRIVHLVNYNAGAPAANSAVEVQVPDDWRIKRVVALRPESSLIEPVEFKQRRDRVSLVLPKIEVYALVSIESEGSLTYLLE